MKQSEINDILIKEFKLSLEQINLIINNFWRGLRYYIVNPFLSKGNILITTLFSLSIKIHFVERYIEKIESKEFKRISYQKHSVEFYKDLLNTLRNERQTESSDIN